MAYLRDILSVRCLVNVQTPHACRLRSHFSSSLLRMVGFGTRYSTLQQPLHTYCIRCSDRYATISQQHRQAMDCTAYHASPAFHAPFDAAAPAGPPPRTASHDVATASCVKGNAMHSAVLMQPVSRLSASVVCVTRLALMSDVVFRTWPLAII